MTRSLPEANSAISRIREMPYGIAHSTAAVAELDRITAEGPQEARAYALYTAVEGYVWGGEVDKAFLPFTQMLRWWDTHPEYFDEQDQHGLFWSFKWMVAHLMDFPTISAQQIDSTLADMQRRYALAGNGMNAVAMSRFGWARMRGAADTENLFREWTSTPRDDFSQCEACDPGDRAAHLYRTGRYEECIRLVEQVLPERPSCASEPGDMLSYLSLAYLKSGDAVGAARAYRAARQNLPQDIPAGSIRARHLEFLARSGNTARALARLLEDQRLLTESDTPYERWIYLRSVGVATGLLQAEHAETALAFPGVPAATLAELDRWVRSEALALAAQFDARNASSAVTDATWAVWNDTTTLAVDLSVFGEHLAPLPPRSAVLRLPPRRTRQCNPLPLRPRTRPRTLPVFSLPRILPECSRGRSRRRRRIRWGQPARTWPSRTPTARRGAWRLLGSLMPRPRCWLRPKATRKGRALSSRPPCRCCEGRGPRRGSWRRWCGRGHAVPRRRVSATSTSSPSSSWPSC